MTDMEVDSNVSSTSGLVPLEKLLSYFQDLESAQNERELEETIFSIKNSLAGSAGLRQLLSQEVFQYCEKEFLMRSVETLSLSWIKTFESSDPISDPN